MDVTFTYKLCFAAEPFWLCLSNSEQIIPSQNERVNLKCLRNHGPSFIIDISKLVQAEFIISFDINEAAALHS